MPTLESLLHESRTVLDEFLAAIHAERQCLQGSSASDLSEITARKSSLANRLADLDTQRDAAQRAKGLATGRKGLDAWLKSLPPAAGREPHAAWAAILERAAEAKRENDVNGKLIAARLQQNQQALGVLLGETGDAGTYGADGQHDTRSGRRTLGSA